MARERAARWHRATRWTRCSTATGQAWWETSCWRCRSTQPMPRPLAAPGPPTPTWCSRQRPTSSQVATRPCSRCPCSRMRTDRPAAGRNGRRVLRAVSGSLATAAVLLLAPSSVLLGPMPAWADSDAEPVTWSVVPADDSGPDSRSVIAHELAPGEQVRDRIAVRNLSAQEVTFDLTAADGFYTSEG